MKAATVKQRRSILVTCLFVLGGLASAATALAGSSPVSSLVATAGQARTTPGDTGGAASVRVEQASNGSEAPLNCPLEFQDVPPAHVFYQSIHCLACNGIIGGYQCGGPGEPCGPTNGPYFRPNAHVTRGQLSKIISLAADFTEQPAPGTQTFEDVPSTHPFYVWIEQMAGRGIIGGYDCGRPSEPCVPPHNMPYFRPYANATRGQISKINALAAQITDPVAPNQQTFEDVPPDNPFYVWVEEMAGRGIIGGYQCGGPGEPCVPANKPYFRPNAPTTRGQMTKIAGNTFYPACLPTVPCGPSVGELLGGGSPFEGDGSSIDGINVDTATGNFMVVGEDIGVVADARGPGLQFVRVYNSLLAGRARSLGYGWTHNYDMYIDGPINPTLYTGNGSTVPFRGSGPNYVHDRRVLAALVRNEDGSYQLTDIRSQMRYQFAVNGRLTRILDRNNYALTIQRDAGGRVQTVTDSAGRTLTLTHNETGKLTRVTDPAGRSVLYAYDASSNLTQVTDVAGNVIRHAYDGNNLLLRITDPNGGVYTNSYDSLRRVSQQSDPMNRRYTFAYVTRGLGTTTTVTDPTGMVGVYKYSCNRLIEYVESPGTSEQAVWRFRRGTGSAYPSGITSITDPNNITTRATWDDRGNQTSSTDAQGQTTTMVYNATNDLIAITDASGIQTTMSYDQGGNLLFISRPLTSTGERATITLGYDPAHPGDVTTLTDARGKQWRFIYDLTFGYLLNSSNPMGETTRYIYSNLGALLSTTSPRGYTTRFAYNIYQDVTVVTNTLGYATRYGQDRNRNRTSIMDANGHLTTLMYNPADELIRATRPDGTHSNYDYDGRKRMIRYTDSLGQSTHYRRDRRGRMVEETDPMSRTTRYDFDAGNRITRVTRPDGTQTNYTFDPRGLITNVAYSDGTTPNVSMAYDVLGRLIRMTDGTGTTTQRYDSLNRLVQVQNGAGQIVSYGYDLAGNQISLTYPGGRRVISAYDDANRLSSVTDWLSNTTRFEYDPDNNVVRETYPNGTRRDAIYDPTNRVIVITHTNTLRATTILEASYTRNPLEYITSSIERITEQGARVERNTYNLLDQLISTQAEGFGEVVTRTYGYDPVYRLTQTGVQPQATPPTTGTRGYNPASEILSLVEQQGGSRIRNYSYQFSPTGDRIRRVDNLGGPTVNLSFDQEDHLTNFNGVAQYRQDGHGLRTSKTRNNVTERFTWDVSRDLPMLLQDGSASYIYGLGAAPIAQVTNSGQVYYYHTDQLGSVRALTGAESQVVNRYMYDPYGGTISARETVSNSFGYTGEYEDEESGLIYLRARHYDPHTQQFISKDPLFSVTEQAYSYANDNPVNFSDPSGLLRIRYYWNGIVHYFPPRKIDSCPTFGMVGGPDGGNTGFGGCAGSAYRLGPTDWLTQCCWSNPACCRIMKGVQSMAATGTGDVGNSPTCLNRGDCTRPPLPRPKPPPPWVSPTDGIAIWGDDGCIPDKGPPWKGGLGCGSPGSARCGIRKPWDTEPPPPWWLVSFWWR